MNEIKDLLKSVAYVLIYSTAVVLISIGILLLLPERLRYGYVLLGLIIVIGFAPLLIMDYKAQENKQNEEM